MTCQPHHFQSSCAVPVVWPLLEYTRTIIALLAVFRSIEYSFLKCLFLRSSRSVRTRQKYRRARTHARIYHLILLFIIVVSFISFVDKKARFSFEAGKCSNDICLRRNVTLVLATNKHRLYKQEINHEFKYFNSKL